MVSKVSMVTYSWRVGVIHAHLVSKVTMVTVFIAETLYMVTIVVTIFKIQSSWRFYVFYKMRPLVKHGHLLNGYNL